MPVWKSHLLKDLKPNVVSGNPKRNSSQIFEGKRYQSSARITWLPVFDHCLFFLGLSEASGWHTTARSTVKKIKRKITKLFLLYYIVECLPIFLLISDQKKGRWQRLRHEYFEKWSSNILKTWVLWKINLAAGLTASAWKTPCNMHSWGRGRRNHTGNKGGFIQQFHNMFRQLFLSHRCLTSIWVSSSSLPNTSEWAFKEAVWHVLLSAPLWRSCRFDLSGRCLQWMSWQMECSSTWKPWNFLWYMQRGCIKSIAQQ